MHSDMKKLVPLEARQTVRRAVEIAEHEGRPVRILFVCLGNICRSPAAEGVMLDIARRNGTADSLELDSAGFYGGHVGDLPDRRMREAAWHRGLRLDHRSRTVKPWDFEHFDLIFGMDDSNISDLHAAAPTLDDERKILRMSDFAVNFPDADSVPDPYWDGPAGFVHVLDLLEDACGELYKELKIGN